MIFIPLQFDEHWGFACGAGQRDKDKIGESFTCRKFADDSIMFAGGIKIKDAKGIFVMPARLVV